MRVQMVSVFDRALGTFLRPFSAPSKGVALRSFMDELRRPDGEMGKHPQDYELWWLGTFDEETGTFGGEPRERLALGSDVASN